MQMEVLMNIKREGKFGLVFVKTFVDFISVELIFKFKRSSSEIPNNVKYKNFIEGNMNIKIPVKIIF